MSQETYQLCSMNQNTAIEFLGWWLLFASCWTFGMFGLDKRRAKRDTTHRISQFSLLLASAVGGWPGGLLGIVLFRHKSAKPSFLLQFLVAFIVFVLLVVGVLKLAGKL